MYIPTGNHANSMPRVTASGTVEKRVVCENCRTIYWYYLSRSVTLVSSGRTKAELERAQLKAELALMELVQSAIDPVACPHCGWYQSSMYGESRWAQLKIGLSYTLLYALSITLACYFILPHNSASQNVSLGLLAGGIGLLMVHLLYLSHNPNHGHPGVGGCNAAEAGRSRGWRDPVDAQRTPTGENDEEIPAVPR